MKRRRRLFNAIAMEFMHRDAYGGEVIPPGSVVIAKEEAVDQYGSDPLRVQYYSKMFGLNEVFLMDATDQQKAWLNQKTVKKLFHVVELSNEWDDFQSQKPAEERYWKGPGYRAFLD